MASPIIDCRVNRFSAIRFGIVFGILSLLLCGCHKPSVEPATTPGVLERTREVYSRFSVEQVARASERFSQDVDRVGVRQAIRNHGGEIVTENDGLRLTVNLASRPLADHALQRLKGLTHLDVLWLAGIGDPPGPNTDDGLLFLGELASLRKLSVSGRGITDGGLHHLSKLEHLEFLGLFETSVTGNGLRELKSLEKLRVVDLRRSPVNDEGLLQIAGLPALRELWLSSDGNDDLTSERTDISSKGLARLAGSKTLKRLALQNMKLGDDAVDGLLALREIHLESLILNDVLPESAVRRVCEGLGLVPDRFSTWEFVRPK
jgi:hypothetical protein